MIAVALATASALSYGASDFSGALASKKASAVAVTVVMQVVSLLALVSLLTVTGVGNATEIDMAWGALGGLGAALGLVTFYRALSIGPMSVAAALTALWSSGIPVGAGLALGDRPALLTLLGIGLALPSAVLVSIDVSSMDHTIGLNLRAKAVAWRRRAATRLLSVLAGCGFGIFFVALSRTSADAGLVPLVGARLASISALAIVLVVSRQALRIDRSKWLLIVIAGVLDCAANSLYLLAVREGSLAWVAAVSSLYPVSTVLLARVVLGERMARIQVAGMATAVAALVLIGVGST